MSVTSQDRKAFQEFLEFLSTVDKKYFSEERFITEAADIAEGQHMLMHLMKVGLDAWVDNDASRPRFALQASPVMKWGGEGPDNPSHLAPLNPSKRYRIRGKMSNEVYISYTIYTGKEEGDWNDGVISAMNHTEFTRDEEGNYELFIEASPTPGALHMEAGKPNCVIARHYWEEPVSGLANPDCVAELDIVCLDEPGYPRPLAPSSLASKLRAAQTFIKGQTLDRPLPGQAETPTWFSMVPNDLPKPERWVPTEGGGAGAVDNAYCAGLTILAPDQALIVEGSWPECVYANVCFWNRYQQAIDYRYRPGSLNRKQMALNADGSWTFVLAHEDPGVANWIDTEGHMVGSLYFRYLMSEGEIEQPRCRVVALADLTAELE
ncbi:MAG: DUF1214 domain-containing protein [Pseudomonadales bacterium]